ncbi:MAG: DEAD/DEAH box helicase [Clostridia bacterium]|nr:DEAD/DEAH box helicase [Clostridia bacterium]
MDASRFINSLVASRDYRDQIAYVETIPARPARYGVLDPPAPPALASALEGMGITTLYTHQAEAVSLARAGHDLVVVTSTASGKTMCYNIPAIESLISSSQATALYIFPTKALAQDQQRGLARFVDLEPSMPVKSGTYDGDTPDSTRRKLREEANIILTNPDMLHQGILPSHPNWRRFFAGLRYVVIDEIHAYRGVFGSNVANVIRRLNRVCAHYGSKPTFICCSATIANPGELAERICGRTVAVVDDDGSPRGPRKFVFWNPPKLGGTMERRSSNHEAEHLMVQLMTDGVPTITFVRARVVAELIYRYTVENLRRTAPSLARKIKPYRAGYLPSDRREIERQLFSGELLGVVSTNALELGIDIGTLDASLIVGYPGTIASTWQQAGRAGRKGEESLAVFIGHDLPIDQYLMRHPEYFFERSPEHAIINPSNPYILMGHLRAASAEIPVAAAELPGFGDYAGTLITMLEEKGDVIRTRKGWRFTAAGFPANDVKLRNMGENTYTIVDTSTEGGNRVIGTIDEPSAFEQVHPEAVYMHEGETYLVSELNLTEKVSYIHKADVDYFTQSVTETRVRIDEEEQRKAWRKSEAEFGDVTVTSLTFMFRKIKFYERDSIGFGKINLPPHELCTTAAWMTLPDSTAGLCEEYGRVPMEGLIGIGNAASAVIPLFAMCDQMDIGTTVDSSNTGVPTLFIYDRRPGGVGFAQKSYEMIEEVMEACLNLIENCPCTDGCPSCVGSPIPPYAQDDPDTTPRGRIPDKETSLLILHDLLERDPYIPTGPPRRRDLQGSSDGSSAGAGLAGGDDGRPTGSGADAGVGQGLQQRRNAPGGNRIGTAGRRGHVSIELNNGPDDRTWKVALKPLPEGVERRIRIMLSRS